MAITKKLIHFNKFSNFNAQKLSANRENTSYTVGVDGELTVGEPYILFHSIVFIKDVLKIWTHGSLYECSETDLSDYLTAEEIAEVYATIDALNGKQDTVADLESIRQGAALGATALQEHQDISGKLDKSEAESTYATIDALKGKQDTVADLETIRQGAALGATALQEHQDISGKLDKSEAKDTYATIESLDTVESIARGKSRAKVFDTVEALDEWLSVPENLEELQVGDNFYISATDVPDYWWDGSQKQPLETEKVDLTEYAKKSDVPTKVSELENDVPYVTDYTIPQGVSIMDDSGNIMTGEEWSEDKGLTGLVVSDGTRNVVMAVTDVIPEGAADDMSINTLKKWSTALEGVDIEGLDNYSYFEDAENYAHYDFNSKANTDAILSALSTSSNPSETDNAAVVARNYSSGIYGKGEWDLPACGILDFLYPYRNEMWDVLESIGKADNSNTFLNITNAWSSTEIEGELAAMYYFSRYVNGVGAVSKSRESVVIPVKEISATTLKEKVETLESKVATVEPYYITSLKDGDVMTKEAFNELHDAYYTQNRPVFIKKAEGWFTNAPCSIVRLYDGSSGSHYALNITFHYTWTFPLYNGSALETPPDYKVCSYQIYYRDGDDTAKVTLLTKLDFKSSGDGTKVLSDDGTYKDLPAAITKVSELENDVPYVSKDQFEKRLSISKYEFVELGLPSGLKWATCNVGASSPEDYGLYFQWGDTQGYTSEDAANGIKEFSVNNYKFTDDAGSTYTKYNDEDGKTVLDLEDDAAWQSDNTCRMPTKEEIQELIDNTTSSWTFINDKRCMMFTASNGNSVIIPAAGYIYNNNILYDDWYGPSWGSSLYDSENQMGGTFYFDPDVPPCASAQYRYHGLTVRPVQEAGISSSFEPSNYYTKSEADEKVSSLEDKVKELTPYVFKYKLYNDTITKEEFFLLRNEYNKGPVIVDDNGWCPASIYGSVYAWNEYLEYTIRLCYTNSDGANVITLFYVDNGTDETATQKKETTQVPLSLKFEDLVADTWVEDTTYADYPYRCDLACSGAYYKYYAEVTYNVAEAISGDYAPICETDLDVVKIWSKKNDSIVVPTVIVTRI